jgi:hypothetical protein
MTYYERYEAVPIPPVKENMELFEAGAISIGVEFRVLTDALIEALGLKDAAAANNIADLDDAGVSLHVFADTPEGNFERLRFDCFGNDPHYHYMSIANRTQDAVRLDPHVIGDPLAWALSVMQSRMVSMLARADVADPGALVDHARLDRIMPLVAEAAYRARFHSDREEIERSANAADKHVWDTGEERSWDAHSRI